MLLSQWVENNPEANARKVVRIIRSNKAAVGKDWWEGWVWEGGQALWKGVVEQRAEFREGLHSAAVGYVLGEYTASEAETLVTTWNNKGVGLTSLQSEYPVICYVHERAYLLTTNLTWWENLGQYTLKVFSCCLLSSNRITNIKSVHVMYVAFDFVRLSLSSSANI